MKQTTIERTNGNIQKRLEANSVRPNQIISNDCVNRSTLSATEKCSSQKESAARGQDLGKGSAVYGTPSVATMRRNIIYSFIANYATSRPNCPQNSRRLK